MKKRLRTNNNNIRANNVNVNLEPAKPAIIPVKDYCAKFSSIAAIDENPSDECETGYYMTNCANCGVWYNPDKNVLENRIGPLAMQIENLKYYSEQLAGTTTSLIKDNPSSYMNNMLFQLRNIYSEYIVSSLYSYFYSFMTPLFDNFDMFKSLMRTIISDNYAYSLYKIVGSHLSILYNSASVNMDYIAVESVKADMLNQISVNISQAINSICYNNTINYRGELVKLSNKEIRSFISFLNFSSRCKIKDSTDLFMYLQELFIAPFQGCSVVIEVLLWQFIRTIDYLNTNNLFSNSSYYNDDFVNNEDF